MKLESIRWAASLTRNSAFLCLRGRTETENREWSSLKGRVFSLGKGESLEAVMHNLFLESPLTDLLHVLHVYTI